MISARKRALATDNFVETGDILLMDTDRQT